jgi:2-amino-4-hydroxy-6-hydroxymethyldihydropteridine diphosphokinase
MGWKELPLDQQLQQAPADLILPHPRLQDRSFVLVPMMDIAPDWEHPVLGMTTRQLLARRPEDEKASICPLDMA